MPVTPPPAVLPARRRDLVVKPFGEDGTHVVKDPRTGGYFKLPPQESYLFALLLGKYTTDQVRAAFQRRFGEPLGDEDLQQFLSLAEGFGFIDETQPAPPQAPAQPQAQTQAQAPSASSAAAAQRVTLPRTTEPAKPAPAAAAAAPVPAPTVAPAAVPVTPMPPSAPTPVAQPAPVAKKEHAAGQSLLYWRKSAFDPDRLFNRLEPWLRFLWTRGFVVASAFCVVAAAAVSWANRYEILHDFSAAWVMRPETLVLAWLTLVLATTLHEFAHGLTCKHFGGEVHEVGFLLMFFIPCFYCNVSDAWLMREKSRRLWVTLAGGWCDLCLWAAAVFVWRLTPADTLPHYIAWVLLGVCGMRVFFNFNPLLKLDGYYLLSDAVDMPNLRGRAWERFTAHVRWLLWGAPQPGAEPRGRFLLLFGLATWVYSTVFLALMVVALFHWWGRQWGTLGAAAALALGAATSRSSFSGLSGGEVGRMFARRRTRAAAWAVAAAAAAAVLCVVPVADRAAGPFRLRAVARAELRAPVAGFLREVRYAEGQRVAAGAVLLRLEVPDLVSKLAQKEAEVAEADARLSMLRAGPAEFARASGDGDGARAHYFQIRAAEAQLRRLREELAYLRELDRRQPVASPVAGVMITPRLAEKVGQYFREGETICEVEDPALLEAEIAVPEQEMARVEPGRPVELKARVLPFDTLRAEVTRVSAGARPATPPAAAGAGTPAPPDTGELPGLVVVYCTLSPDAAAAGARAGMTGHARIECGRAPAARVWGRRVLRYVRTEFWW